MGVQTKAKLTFTNEERGQIRDALLRYAADHSLGTTELIHKILKHDPLDREMSARTLVRFLSNERSTKNHNVSICYEFVKELPYFGEENAAVALGGPVASFYQVASLKDVSWSLTEKRAFHVGFLNKSPQDWVPHSTVLLEPIDDPRFVKSTEVVTNLSPETVPTRWPAFRAEGIAFPVDATALMFVMRDTLTRRPRVSLWSANEDLGADTVLTVTFEESGDAELPNSPIVSRSLQAKPEQKISPDWFI